LRAYGADLSALPERLTKPKTFEVWPEHEDVVIMFLRCQTQWRVSMNGVMGLDYGVILQMMELYAVEDRRQLMEDLQVMESHARDLLNNEAAKAQKQQTAGKARRAR
jgi:hypothetical protein